MTFRKLKTGNETLDRIQDNIDASFRPLDRNPMYGAVLVEGITLLAGQDNLVSHKLTQRPIAFIVASLDSNSNVWTQTSVSLGNQSSNERLINLRSSANCVASLIFS